MRISVQEDDFDVGLEIDALCKKQTRIGAVTSFVGLVRDDFEAPIIGLELEHYAEMTQKALTNIGKEALHRFDIFDLTIIHRFGYLALGERIVLVVTVGSHRSQSFQACEFIMDYLKTQAPFWKKEKTSRGNIWVEANKKDDTAFDKWNLGKVKE
ncbi:MAG: molybdenum cofactor biosynthesis protein MoaE [Proteobacteria bacterium]|nr:molybdenum cofactor biosynthesis protein MoaE [Pseudomonadota bacterium]MDE3207532.1 molybdenum cofactor biosynthesis protein MoaE [Pseudomonadota bacterium]